MARLEHTADEPLLRVRNLQRQFGGQRNIVGVRTKVVQAVKSVSFSVTEGKALGIVGESGCGKSTVARMVAGLLAPTAGTIEFDGAPVTTLSQDARRNLYRKVQLVFQDPLSSLNPRKTIRHILETPLRSLTDMSSQERSARIDELMQQVGLRTEFLERYPHEFSGGQAQRIAIARALAPRPKMLILDEPVSALDVSVQAQVLGLLKDLQQQLDLTYIFISHDLAVVEYLCDELLVMYFGEVVERGTREDVFGHPQHEYTRLLLSSIPTLS